MRALRKGQARPWCLQPGIRGEVRLVERAFGIEPSALTEAMGLLNHHFAAAAGSAQRDSLPLTAANLGNRSKNVGAHVGPPYCHEPGIGVAPYVASSERAEEHGVGDVGIE